MFCPIEITRKDIKALEEILKKEDVEPGRLMSDDMGYLTFIINQMLYDKFHGHGYKLDLVTGQFVKTKGE